MDVTPSDTVDRVRWDDRFDAVLLDAGGVLVLPDPTVLAPLLAYYGGTQDHAAYCRAHYAAMAAKSHAGAGEVEWDDYDHVYVRSVGVDDDVADEAAQLLGRTRTAHLWRWPIPDSVAGLRLMHEAGVPLGVVSNASGQIEAVLARSGVCQVGEGPNVPVRVVVDSHVVGVAKPDPGIFEPALAHFAGIARGRIAYVGDSVTMDVHGARAAGLHPVLLDPHDDHPGLDATRIRSLADLVG
jgi:putative hydrolase of the HAD superfamily